ncbi:hypothetical protein HMPREF9413_2223 [Paenibacillus sp. HGF7]|nr:hypothetical protein HMPREF9413_2223 [Paenibacillus sp. HGF7]
MPPADELPEKKGAWRFDWGRLKDEGELRVSLSPRTTSIRSFLMLVRLQNKQSGGWTWIFGSEN